MILKDAVSIGYPILCSCTYQFLHFLKCFVREEKPSKSRQHFIPNLPVRKILVSWLDLLCKQRDASCSKESHKNVIWSHPETGSQCVCTSFSSSTSHIFTTCKIWDNANFSIGMLERSNELNQHHFGTCKLFKKKKRYYQLSSPKANY